MRQLAAFQGKLAELETLDATVYAASADRIEGALEAAAESGVKFHIAYGVTRQDCDLVGGWWQEAKGYMQPAEFILERGGLVLASMYASGPLGRMNPGEVVTFLNQHERRRLERQGVS